MKRKFLFKKIFSSARIFLPVRVQVKTLYFNFFSFSENKKLSIYMVSFIMRNNYDKNIKIKFGLNDKHG